MVRSFDTQLLASRNASSVMRSGDQYISCGQRLTASGDSEPPVQHESLTGVAFHRLLKIMHFRRSGRSVHTLGLNPLSSSDDLGEADVSDLTFENMTIGCCQGLKSRLISIRDYVASVLRTSRSSDMQSTSNLRVLQVRQLASDNHHRGSHSCLPVGRKSFFTMQF